MPIYKSKYFKESALAHELLDGKKGVEIGGSIHNAFGLDVLNVDYTADENTVFKQMEKQLTYGKNGVAECMPVDVVASGEKLPFEKKSFAFVINSHVVEHIFDPICAIKEWMRVATDYVYMVIPKRDALAEDAAKPLTTLKELVNRHTGATPFPAVDDHRHWSIWTLESFTDMCNFYGWKICATLETDDKVGNGFTVVIDVRASEGKLILEVSPLLEIPKSLERIEGLLKPFTKKEPGKRAKK